MNSSVQFVFVSCLALTLFHGENTFSFKAGYESVSSETFDRLGLAKDRSMKGMSFMKQVRGAKKVGDRCPMVYVTAASPE